MPALVRSEIGEKALKQASGAAGIDLELIDGQNCFIPHAAVLMFLHATAKAAREDNLGLLMTPQMDVADYGAWADYLLGADTLALAIERSIATLGYHSTGDTLSVAVDGDQVRYSNGFALAGHTGYEHVACVSAGVLLSLCRRYTFAAWRPLRVDLDIAQATAHRGFRGPVSVPGHLRCPCGDRFV